MAYGEPLVPLVPNVPLLLGMGVPFLLSPEIPENHNEQTAGHTASMSDLVGNEM
jgi:hypothetical protein